MGKRLCIVVVAAVCVLLAFTLASGGGRHAAGPAPAAESATPAAPVRPVPSHAGTRPVSGRTYVGSLGKAHVVVRAPTTGRTPHRPPESEATEVEPHHRLTPEGRIHRLHNANAAPLRAAAGLLYVNKHKDLGCGAPGYCSLVNEPSLASNGNGSILQTWNWWAARSNDRGSSFTYLDPYSTFPASYGGFCCDQLAYYEPSRDLFIWVLQYSQGPTGDNTIRIAVANGAAGLAANTWHYWDLTTDRVGAALDWFDQPKIGTSANYAYIEVSKYRKLTNDGDGSVLIRIKLDDLAHPPSGTLNFDAYNPTTFSPAPVQRAASTMYFGSHATTTTLRLYSWPESTTAVSVTDVPNTNYPQHYPYSCPKTGHGAASPSDWCPRASGTGGYAHDDRINTGWVANGVIGFSWDASQGAVSGGVHPSFKYPYVHVLRISEATKTRLDEPIIYSPKYAVEWPSLAANSAGDVGGSIMWGGGAFEENCAAVVHDSRSGPGFWEFHKLASSKADTAQAKSGDYTTSRGVGTGWISACYTVGSGGDTGSVHPQYFAFSRTPDSLQPPCVVPNVVGKTLVKARAKIKSRSCRVGKITRAKSTKRQKGRVIRQKPAPATQRGHNAKVSLWIGRGPKR